jgi:DNA polymerase V
VVAIVDGELTIERLRLEHGRVRLQAENPDYPDIVVPELAELSIWVSSPAAFTGTMRPNW